MHTLDASEIERIDIAAQFVNDHLKQHDSLPTDTEFQSWANQAPPHLQLEGVGLTYKPTPSGIKKSYVFSFWDGDNCLCGDQLLLQKEL